jgi:hypothetical protein
MARVEDSIIQDEIANSLLGSEAEQQAPEQTQSEYAIPGDQLLDEERQEQQFGDRLVLELGDEEAAAYREKYGQSQEQPEAEARQPQERLRSERAPQESEQAQPQAEQTSQPLTPEVIREGLQELSTYSEANQLNQGESAATFPHEICAAIGTTLESSGLDVKEAVALSSETAVAGLREFSLCKGDLSKLPPMPDELAFAAGYRWAKAHGYDPQDENIDLCGIGRMQRQGTLSILHTINAGYTDPAQINSPESINWFRVELQKLLGSNRPLSYEQARNYCNAYAKRVSGVVGQLRQNQGQETQERQPRRSGQRVPARFREGIKGSKAPRFKSNLDVFDSGTMDFYNQQHGRL